MGTTSITPALMAAGFALTLTAGAAGAASAAPAYDSAYDSAHDSAHDSAPAGKDHPGRGGAAAAQHRSATATAGPRGTSADDKRAHGQGRKRGQGHHAGSDGPDRGRGAAHGRPGQGHDATRPSTSAQAPGAPAAGGGTPAAGGHGRHAGAQDPAGNNGTVKIITPGESDRIPDNDPHPGCSVGVEWYGFDAGSDVVSAVGFTMQAPTADATVSVDGPLRVPVGGDGASGAGTATGLDARETYTLSFTGTPHPKQGYHVKVTVATPRSLGNDTKTKVFWVEPCAPGASSALAGGLPARPGAASGAGTVVSEGGVPQGATVEGAQAAGVQAREVTGSATAVASSAGSGSAAAGVPTAVDAGEGGSSTAARIARPLVPLALVAAGGALALAALRRRRRA